MSIYTYHSTALANPDPWAACHYLLEEHPRYHDCKNCEHNLHCDYGLSALIDNELDATIEECRTLHDKLNKFGVPSIDPNFRLKYAPTA